MSASAYTDAKSDALANQLATANANVANAQTAATAANDVCWR